MTTEPAASEPAAARPGGNEPETSQPETSQPGAARRRMTSKRGALLALAAGGGILILGWSQAWFVLTLTDGRSVDVAGSTAGGGVLAAGLAALACAGALSIAAIALRYVLGAVAIVLGGVGIAVAAVGLSRPVASGASAITEQTGVAGVESVAGIVESASATGWPWVAILGGAVVIVAGAIIVATARHWPASASRYDRGAAQQDDWDTLTSGQDPTR